MKDKFNDLIPWLEKLLEDLAKVGPDDDREEARRRPSRLARFVSFCFFFLFFKKNQFVSRYLLRFVSYLTSLAHTD